MRVNILLHFYFVYHLLYTSCKTYSCCTIMSTPYQRSEKIREFSYYILKRRADQNNMENTLQQVITYEIFNFHDLHKEYIFLHNKHKNNQLQYTFADKKQVFHTVIIKCSLPGGNIFIECRFSILWISEAFSLREVIEMLEKMKICR